MAAQHSPVCEGNPRLLANAGRKENLATARALLNAPASVVAEPKQTTDTGSTPPTFVCRHCGAPMIVIETFARVTRIRAPPPGAL